MNTIGNIRLTPEKIVDKGLYFGIPIYQRLFTWTEKQVARLMSDLYEHYILTEKAAVPYYIGALSCVYQNNRYDLIDGQQRMTAMALIGIAFNNYSKNDNSWDKFLAKGERVHFVARSSDAAYFQGRILGQTNCTNQNKLMEEGIDTINTFLSKNFSSENEINEFGNWIFQNLSFFISVLPESYTGNKHLLNKYFENMNSSGKGLEQHDILKVQLIRGQQNQEYLTRIWNAACDFSQNIIKSKSEESNSDYANRYKDAIRLCRNGDFAGALSKCIKSYDEEDRTTIGEIKPIAYEKDTSSKTIVNNPSLLKISEFLITVLDLQDYDGIQIRNKDSYYNQSLLKAFNSETISHLDINKFYEDLLFYRLLLDCYFITLSREDINLNYDLILHSNERERTAQCRQFEAMLYVSDTPIYYWITPILYDLKINGDINAEGLLEKLKRNDRNFRGNVDISQLRYPEVKVYWFRRLEYLIWENRRELFKEDEHSLEVAENYRFVSNRRSREHIVPQNPKSESNLFWRNDDTDSDIMNSFGNLVLISSSLNSKLSNESYEIKKAYVQSYQNRSMGGSIESLSLLLFHTQYPKLTPDNMRDSIINYGKFTYEILQNSF